MKLDTILRDGPVIPVVVVERVADAVPLARALVAGGVRVIELTLRTSCALEAIQAIATQVEGAIIGAGTVTQPDDIARCVAAGARFCVSPGLTPALAAAAAKAAMPLLPGVMTPSEVMAARDAGHRALKFFPAHAAGGVAMLKALGGPLADVTFCPTGGITAASAPDYLALPNVACVGGTWLAPADAIAAGDWARITRLGKQARALASR